jgi:isocitrate dehydrogenase (NAD+)
MVEATGARSSGTAGLAGIAALEAMNTPLPEETLESIRRNRVALKGPLTTPSGPGSAPSTWRCARSSTSTPTSARRARCSPDYRYQDIDLVLIRENTEGLYSGVEHYVGIGGDPRAAAESVMIVTRFGVERILRYAFEYAVAHGRRKVTLAHKANILKYTQGLFLDMGREMARSTRTGSSSRTASSTPPRCCW